MTEGNGDVRELPRGWCCANLEEVAEILDKYREPINSSERSKRIEGKSSEELFPYYGATGQVGYIDGYLLQGEHVLLGEDGAPFLDFAKNKAYLVQGRFWVNNHAHILKAFTSNKYLCHFLNQVNYKDFVTGTTRLKLNQALMKKILIKLPPFKEQKRVVEKIEELFSELDQGVESLKTAQKQLKIYRQAVLKWAFEGKLTEEWRKQQSTLKTGEALLAEIKAERENRYQQQLAEWEKAVETWEAIGKVGKKPSKPSKLKDVSLLTETELSELPELPHTWCWLRFGELVSSIRGGTTAVPIDIFTDYPILRSSSVRAGTIDYSDVRFLTPEQASAIKDFVEVDDLLFTRLNGTVDYVGNCSRVTEYYPKNLIYPDRLYCAKLLLANMAKYVEKVFENPILRRIIEKRAKSTAGHKRISISDVLDMPFPLPNLEEVDVILLDLETKLSIVEKLEATIIENLQKAEALRQSILKQAFEGKLVPQDPNDEPAEKLLERIKAEREVRRSPKASNQLKIKGL